MAIHVLLVDDDPVQAMTRKAILDRAGYVVQIAADGLEALEVLRSPRGSAFSLVLTDHLMPRMNGPEFVRSLRHSGSQVPVLVLSGFADAEDEYENLDVAFRVKPFPPESLLSLVKYLLSPAERRSA